MVIVTHDTLTCTPAVTGLLCTGTFLIPLSTQVFSALTAIKLPILQDAVCTAVIKYMHCNIIILAS